MFSSTIGALRVIIGGDTKDLDKSLGQAEQRLSGFGKKLTGIVAAVGIAAAAAAIVTLTKNSFETIDAQSKLAYRLDASVGSLQTLEYAADLAGLTTEALTNSVSKLNQKLAEAARTGEGPAYEALRRLGLSAKDLLSLDIDDRMVKIAEAFQRLGYTSSQQADALKALGLRTQEIINLFEDGGSAIRDARKDLEDFGGILSNIDAHTIEQANDAWTKAARLVKALFDQLAVALAPVVKEIGERLTDAGRNAGGFGNVMRDVVRESFVGLGIMQRALYDIGMAWGNLTDKLSAAGSAIKAAILATLPNKEGMLQALGEMTASWSRAKETAGEPPDPQAWGRFYDDMVKRTQEAAQKVMQAREKTKGGPTLDPLSDEQRKQLELKFVQLQKSLATESAALDYWRQEELLKLKEFEDKKIGTAQERNAARLAIETKYQKDRADLIFSKLEEYTATENDILAKKHADQLRAIGEFEAARTITETQASELRRKYAEKQALDILQLQAKQYSGLANIVDTAMGQISQVIGKEGGAAFEIMKAISVATAVVKGFEATVSAYAYGASIGGPPLGAAMAAIAAAGTAAQIAAIIRTKPSGAGSTVTAPATGGGSAAEAAPAPAPAGGGTTLTVSGLDPSALFTGEMVRGLAQKLIQFQRDGGTVVLA
jgi:hypothetical protein